MTVNPFAPTIENLHFHADELALQLWLEKLVDTVTVWGDNIGQGHLARPTVNVGEIVRCVAFGLQPTILRRTLPVVIDGNAERIWIVKLLYCLLTY